jgi:sulfide dehydrogenase [flavocytochrome c] flavoprotein chain
MTSGFSRRQFGAGLVAASAISAMPLPACARGEANVVIVGGGPAGATVAVTLKKTNPKLNVTLIETKTKYTSCFFSNGYIGGLYGVDDLTHTYKGLISIGINVIHDTVTMIDTNKKSLKTRVNKEHSYDRLVVAPGIDFKWDTIQDYSEETAEIMPHAWRGGSQSVLLRKRLEKMDDGGTVVITAPPLPYRCPPGPYERACVIAHYLKTRKPKSKVVILDAKMTFSKQAVFQEAFTKYYKDIIELHLSNDIDDQALARVDARTGEITTKAGLKIKSAVANIIPPQTAGAIAIQAGLTKNDWCPIKPENFASALAEHVYVLGDAAIATDMPKSAFTAHSQGLAVAADILADLEQKPRPTASYRNTCWSLLAPGDAAKIGANYAPGELPGGKKGLVPKDAFVSKPGETDEVRKATYEEAYAWYPTLISQAFNKTMNPIVASGR